jgi:2,3-bisphosphoglycerate-independent phosphoglycerate mutase
MVCIMNTPPPHSPLVLIVLDGWGYRENSEHNAIADASTPCWHQLWQRYPHTLAEASGLTVGLPAGQMGNSEVGHLHMGAGRQVLQDLTRIDLAIQSGEFYNNPVLNQGVDAVIRNGQALHVFGLLSPGGVHSHELHIQALIKLAAKRGLKKIYVHAFLDGRDTPPQSAKNSLLAMENIYQELGCGKTASLIGRYYAMDRDKRWERTQRAYDLLTQGKTEFHVATALEGLEKAYARNENDEFVLPTAIHDHHSPVITVQSGDAVVFMNFRADRARQITRAFTDSTFDGFKRNVVPSLSHFITLTNYAADLNAQVVYPPLSLRNNVGECVAAAGYKQLRIAETEKYAHVTFFFNGGEEKLYPGEDRILIPSPKVATYDLQPAMSARELTNALITAIQKREYAFIICNFANPDMVGHTGNLAATVDAVEVIDECLMHIVAALKEVGGEALITADHGNAECMFDEKTGQPHTAHTTNLVPVIYVGRPGEATTQQGTLYDIAPTLLDLMGIKEPIEMTGKTLFNLNST